MLEMKATMDIPDELYRKVKARSALRGETVRSVAVQLFSQWIDEQEQPSTAVVRESALPVWFASARKYARRVQKHDMTTIRRSIARGRTGHTSRGMEGNGNTRA